jgi:signal peptidase I
MNYRVNPFFVSRRRLFLAFFLGFVLPGIGHLYLGFIRRGIILLLVGLAITIGVSIGESNYNHNGGSLLESLFVISVIIWIIAGLWQISDLREIVKKRLPKRESKTPAEFKNLAMLVVGIIVFKIAFLVVMEVGDISFTVAAATGSMIPTINGNDIIFIQSNGGVDGSSSSFANLKRGDIITFTSPIGNESIVHRIVDIKLDSSGNRIIKTKGDANPSSYLGMDYPIREQNYTGKVIYIFPPIFGLFLDLTNPPFYPIIVASVIAVIFYSYKNKEREKVEEGKREQEEEQETEQQQQRQQTTAIRLRRYAFTATAILLVAILLVDSYILVNPYIPVNLGHNVGDFASAKIATIGDNNNLYVIWNDYSAGGKYDIMLAKSTDGGNNFGKAINVSHNLGYSIYPAIAASPLSKNVLYTTWEDNSTGNYEIYFAKSTDGGNSFGKVVNISNDLGLSGRPSIAAYNDNVYVVWNDNSTGNYEIYFAKSTDGGNSFGKSTNLSNNKRGISGFPSVAVSTNNTIYVSWIGVANNTRLNPMLNFTKSTDAGNSFIQPLNLIREVSDPPAVAASGKTNLFIIWAANFTGNYVIRLKKSTDGGNIFSEPVNLTNRNGLSSSPQIFPSKNALFIVWYTQAGPIRFTNSTDGGNTFSEPIDLSKNTDRNSFFPHIAASGNNIYVVWTDTYDRNNAIFFSKSTDGGYTFSDPVDLSKNTE